MLSTRRDLIPADIADELAKLQDRVPPFPSESVVAILDRVYGKPVDQVFQAFDRTPVASASVAQVHFATLHDGTPVAVKVLRPGIASVIDKDIGLMYAGATLMEKLWSDGRRLRPREVVAEFEKTLQRRARPDARGGQLLAAAPQFPVLAAAAGARRALGFLHPRSDGDGADERDPDLAGGQAASKRAST